MTATNSIRLSGLQPPPPLPHTLTLQHTPQTFSHTQKHTAPHSTLPPTLHSRTQITAVGSLSKSWLYAALPNPALRDSVGHGGSAYPWKSAHATEKGTAPRAGCLAFRPTTAPNTTPCSKHHPLQHTHTHTHTHARTHAARNPVWKHPQRS